MGLQRYLLQVLLLGEDFIFTRDLQETAHLSYKDRLREPEMFSLEKERLWGDIRAPSST